jgi:hypothetical protein
VVGFFIKPIEDYNEVTHHLVETLFAHLAITKPLPVVRGLSIDYNNNDICVSLNNTPVWLITWAEIRVGGLPWQPALR